MDWDSIRAHVLRLGALAEWAPDWLIGICLLVVAILATLALHRLAVALLRRAIGPRDVFLWSLLTQTMGPTRLAAAIVAAGIALQVAPFDSALAQALNHALGIAFIVLLGWIAAIAIRIAAELYLRRYHVEAEDNLLARKHTTQVRILERAADTLIMVVTVACALMTFESVRHYGVSLFASAGIAGIAVGLAARPLLANLIAGIQIAMTQPIRLGDAVVVANEFGFIDEIAATYVVIRVWDERRLIVPLSEFIEKPFQNWTHHGSALLGTVLLRVDYTAPVERIREKLEEVARKSTLWDGKVVNLQVTDSDNTTIELRALVSARSAPALFDLRCEVREKLIGFLQHDIPDALPRRRAEMALHEGMGFASAKRGHERGASAA